MIHTEPPPAYPDDNRAADPMAGNDEQNYKHPFNVHFSEESIRKGSLCLCASKLLRSHYYQLNSICPIAV